MKFVGLATTVRWVTPGALGRLAVSRQLYTAFASRSTPGTNDVSPAGTDARMLVRRATLVIWISYDHGPGGSLTAGLCHTKRGVRVHYPELDLCTDNGAMIAMAAAMRLAAGVEAANRDYAFDVKPRWPLDELNAVVPAEAGTQS